MRKYVLATHGKMAEGMLTTIEMLAGTQENLTCINDNPKFLKNYRSALAMAIALLAMCVTNFVLDAPLTAILTNYLNEKTEEKKHE